jgi:hypothetical protein
LRLALDVSLLFVQRLRLVACKSVPVFCFSHQRKLAARTSSTSATNLKASPQPLQPPWSCGKQLFGCLQEHPQPSLPRFLESSLARNPVFLFSQRKLIAFKSVLRQQERPRIAGASSDFKSVLVVSN